MQSFTLREILCERLTSDLSACVSCLHIQFLHRRSRLANRPYVCRCLLLAASDRRAIALRPHHTKWIIGPQQCKTVCSRSISQRLYCTLVGRVCDEQPMGPCRSCEAPILSAAAHVFVVHRQFTLAADFIVYLLRAAHGWRGADAD